MKQNRSKPLPVCWKKRALILLVVKRKHIFVKYNGSCHNIFNAATARINFATTTTTTTIITTAATTTTFIVFIVILLCTSINPVLQG